ncbi:hypothetical protein J6590_043447 [Homalodisca vitripennis]|nr:hypothetical protein J6590_043447 [Homalodisca vitripennis]
MSTLLARCQPMLSICLKDNHGSYHSYQTTAQQPHTPPTHTNNHTHPPPPPKNTHPTNTTTTTHTPHPHHNTHPPTQFVSEIIKPLTLL